MTLHQTSRLSPVEAADVARQLIAINEDYNTVNSSAGASDHIRHNLLSQLLDRIEEVLALELPQPAGLNLAGRISLDLGLVKLAKDYFQRATTLAPTEPTYLLNYANSLALLSQFERARVVFDSCLKVDKHNIHAFIGIAFCLLSNKQYDQAFLHYRSILAHGYKTTAVHDQLCECLENLSCDQYTPELELLIDYVLKVTDVDTTRALSFAAQLLSLKHDLNNPECAIELDTLESDPLLLAILETGLVHDAAFEQLVTQLRLSIFSESATSKVLRDELMPCAIALGVYAAHADHALTFSSDEEYYVDQLKIQVSTTIGTQRVVIDDIAGALILIGMYEPLYVQNFSFDLLGLDLEDWPAGIQSLMLASLYALSAEHQSRYELFGQTMSELLENGVTRANARWKPIPAPYRLSFYQTIKTKISPALPPSSWQNNRVRILLLACGSGQQAFQYATQFSNVTVMAADANQINMAYAHTQTKDAAQNNLEYAVADYSMPPKDIEPFDYIEFGEGFDFRYLNDWVQLLRDNGIARLTLPSASKRELTGVLCDLVKARGLQPSLDNIRLLRNSILLEKDSTLWTPLFEDTNFYSGAGCRELIFNPAHAFYDLDKAYQLIDAANLNPAVARPHNNALVSNEQSIELFATRN